MIFVNSMSDLFHKAVPKDHIASVFDTMERADWHIYQVLTKRSSLLRKFTNERYKTRSAPPHIWFGVSVENAQATELLDDVLDADDRFSGRHALSFPACGRRSTAGSTG